MAQGLEMGTGPSKPVKIGIAAAIVAVIGGGAIYTMSGGDQAAAEQQKIAAAPAGTGAESTAAGEPMTDTVSAVQADPAAAADPMQAAAADPAGVGAQPADAAAAPAATELAAATPPPSAEPGTATAPAATDPTAAAPAATSPAASEATSEMAMADTGSKSVASADSAAAPAIEKSEKPKQPVSPPPPPPDAMRAWWTASDASQFGVRYVGQTQGQSSLAILFNRVVDPAAVAPHIKVIGPDGTPVAANFQPGGTPMMVVQNDLQPGRYTVMIEKDAVDKQGKPLGTQLYGPVYIQQEKAQASEQGGS